MQVASKHYKSRIPRTKKPPGVGLPIADVTNTVETRTSTPSGGGKSSSSPGSWNTPRRSVRQAFKSQLLDENSVLNKSDCSERPKEETPEQAASATSRAKTSSIRKSKRLAEAAVTPRAQIPAKMILARSSKGKALKRFSDFDMTSAAATPFNDSFHTCHGSDTGSHDSEYYSCAETSFTGGKMSFTTPRTTRAAMRNAAVSKPVALDFDGCE